MYNTVIMKIKIFLRDSALLSLIPGIFSFFLYRIIPIQNVNPLSIVSVTASINSIFWTLMILQIFVNYPLLKKYSIKFIVEINLTLILIYVITFKVLIKALSLKGTPLPGSDIRGDLLAIYKLAKEAQLNFWPGGNGSYPPVWPSLIGNAARILDVPLLSLFKPAEFILLIISPLVVLYIWRLMLAPWMALVVTINQMLFFGFDYKTLTLNIIIPISIYILIKSRENTTKILSNFYTYGFFIGFVSLVYFGYIYWLIPLLLGITLFALISKNRERYLKSQTYFYLGLGTGLGPVAYFMLLKNIYYYYILVLGLLLIIIILRKRKKAEIIFHFLFNIGLFLGLSGALLFYRSLDTWVEGGVEKNDPTVSSILHLSGINLVLFLVLLFGFYFILRTNKDITIIVGLVSIYISSTFFMYLIASQMQVTFRVDLWPRATEVQNYTLNLIFIIVFLFFIEALINEKTFKKHLILTEKNLFYLFSLILFISSSYLVSTLGSSAYGSMPYHAFQSAWYAHQGCSNPHEDPMLSKVFENNPDIQNFLRINCPSATWPEIPKID
jgi:hypothetical protein